MNASPAPLRGQPVARRGGLTLFEIVLSLAILLMALAALGQLYSTGARAAIESRLQTQAVVRCEAVLNEVIAGVHAMQTTATQPFEDDPNWTWSLDVAAGPHVDLLELQVIVTHSGQGPQTNLTYALNRYIRDPQLYVDAALAAEEAESGL